MITIAPKAAEKAKEIMTNEKKNFLRIAVQGGGCSGFQYNMLLEDEKTETDQEFDIEGVKVIVDPISINYLKDIKIDFSDNLTGGGFTINNPNAKSTCGCGSSFEPGENH